MAGPRTVHIIDDPACVGGHLIHDIDDIVLLLTPLMRLIAPGWINEREKCVLRLVRVCNFRMEQQLKMAKVLCVPSVSCLLSNLAATSANGSNHRDDRHSLTPPLAASTARPQRAHRADRLLSARLAYLPS
jgi:hypothetical protein